MSPMALTLTSISSVLFLQNSPSYSRHLPPISLTFPAAYTPFSIQYIHDSRIFGPKTRPPSMTH